MRVLACIAVFLVASTAWAARLNGTSRADVLRGTSKADVIDGRAGRDRIFGNAGGDQLVGGKGGDLLVGGPGADRIDARDRGGACELRQRAPSASPLDYPRCADTIVAGPGADTIRAIDGRLDVIWFCGDGRDTVYADRSDTVPGDCESVGRARDSLQFSDVTGLSKDGFLRQRTEYRDVPFCR